MSRGAVARQAGLWSLGCFILERQPSCRPVWFHIFLFPLYLSLSPSQPPALKQAAKGMRKRKDKEKEERNFFAGCALARWSLGFCAGAPRRAFASAVPATVRRRAIMPLEGSRLFARRSKPRAFNHVSPYRHDEKSRFPGQPKYLTNRNPLHRHSNDIRFHSTKPQPGRSKLRGIGPMGNKISEPRSSKI
jgi:hypothetical protein